MRSGLLGALDLLQTSPQTSYSVCPAHRVGPLAWFLQGCSGTKRSGLSQLPGPALGRLSHVAEMSKSSAWFFALVFLGQLLYF